MEKLKWNTVDLHFKVWIIINCDHTEAWECVFLLSNLKLPTNSKLPAKAITARSLISAPYSSSALILGHPEMSLSPLLPSKPSESTAETGPRGGRSSAQTLPGWSLSGAQTWACNWLRQPPLVVAANKVKVHRQWQLTLCGNRACHVIKNRILDGKWGRHGRGCAEMISIS